MACCLIDIPVLFPLRQGHAGNRAQARQRQYGVMLVHHLRCTRFGELDLVGAQMFWQTCAPNCLHAVARLKNASHTRAICPSDKTNMATHLAGQQINNRRPFPVFSRGKNDGLICPVHLARPLIGKVETHFAIM